MDSNVDLEGLSDVEETIHFTNSLNLRHTIRDFFDNARDRDLLCDHTILIVGFPLGSLPNDDYDDDETLLPQHSKILYLKDLKALFITMAGVPHARASRMFGRLLDQKIMAMNCDDEFAPTGNGKRDLFNLTKHPDESWTPDDKNYITLAVETGVSESERSSVTDAKIWLEHEESHVAQVVTIRVSRVQENICFKVWTATPQDRGGTRAQYPRRATEVQNVSVVLTEGRPTADGTITLSFESLLERRPHPGTAEKDIVFSARELCGIARKVWKDLGFTSVS